MHAKADQPVVFIRLDPDLKARAMAAAESSDRTLSAWIRRLVRIELDEKAAE
jgi:predicted transcriptional regulator